MIVRLFTFAVFFFECYGHLRVLHSFPTRRSSDLMPPPWSRRPPPAGSPPRSPRSPVRLDRKSTRLNSSHTVISYAVFCLKKKNNSKVCALYAQLIVSRDLLPSPK